jgi:hypothetical protein
MYRVREFKRRMRTSGAVAAAASSDKVALARYTGGRKG